jgi:hypothetical protein
MHCMSYMRMQLRTERRRAAAQEYGEEKVAVGMRHTVFEGKKEHQFLRRSFARPTDKFLRTRWFSCLMFEPQQNSSAITFIL